MPYRLPTYNLLCSVFTHQVVTDPPRVVDVECGLMWGRKVNNSFQEPSDGGGPPVTFMYLLVPAETDLRGYFQDLPGDAVEVPQGSGRFYSVAFCDLVGAGFPNQHKAAVLYQLAPFRSPDLPPPDIT